MELLPEKVPSPGLKTGPQQISRLLRTWFYSGFDSSAKYSKVTSKKYFPYLEMSFLRANKGNIVNWERPGRIHKEKENIFRNKMF